MVYLIAQCWSDQKKEKKHDLIFEAIDKTDMYMYQNFLETIWKVMMHI